MTSRKHLEKYYLTAKQLVVFKDFIKDTGLTLKEIAELDSSELDSKEKQRGTISIMLNKRVRIALANRVVEAYLVKTKDFYNKYKNLMF